LWAWVGDVRQNWWNPSRASDLQAVRSVAATFDDFAPANEVKSNQLCLRRAWCSAANRFGNRSARRQYAGGGNRRFIAIVRIMGILMGIFGLVALALSSIGVYGVLSESVAQRTHK